jgi:hypothetical protein
VVDQLPHTSLPLSHTFTIINILHKHKHMLHLHHVIHPEHGAYAFLYIIIHMYGNTTLASPKAVCVPGKLICVSQTV